MHTDSRIASPDLHPAPRSRRAMFTLSVFAITVASILQSCTPSPRSGNSNLGPLGGSSGGSAVRPGDSLDGRSGTSSEGKVENANPGVIGERPEITFTREDWTFDAEADQPGTLGQLLVSPSYRIYTTMQWPQYVDSLPKFFEAALDHYVSAITPLPRPSRPLDTYVMANRPQWARLTQRVMRDEADVYLRIQRGGFTANGRAILYFIGPYDTLAISAHESWHQYTQTTFRNQLPVWMEEGLACYMEGFRWNRRMQNTPKFMPWANVERFEALRKTVREGRLVPLRRLTTQTPQELMGGDPNDALAFYAQTWALIHFLNEGEGGRYRGALVAILADAVQGRIMTTIQRKLGGRAANTFAFQRRGTELLAAYVNSDLIRLEAEYEAFVTSLVRITARDRIVQGISPFASTNGNGAAENAPSK
jgi:hypothetical protein